MTTIDKLDIGIYIQYARRTQLIEQINQQYHLQEAASIPPQTRVVDFYPKLSEMDLLLGIAPAVQPWAFFAPPQRFDVLRRSPFAFYRVLPSFDKKGGQKGEDQEQESEQDRQERLLNSIECVTEEEKAEKTVIQGCLNQINQINQWMGFIVGRVGQFLQG